MISGLEPRSLSRLAQPRRLSACCLWAGLLRAGLLSASLLGVLLAFSSAVHADVERKPEKTPPESPAEKEGDAKDGERKEGEKGEDPDAPKPPPGDPKILKPELAPAIPRAEPDSRPDLVADPLFQRLRLRLEEWRRSGREVRSGGILAHAWLAPDAFAYQAAKHYLQWRREGHSPATTREKLRALAPRWKRYEDASLVVVTLDNELYETPAVATDPVQLVTQSDSLTRSAFVLADERDRRVALRLGGRPLHLREARLRVRRFWLLSDARTGGGARSPGSPRAGPIVGGPTFAPRKPKLSKPFDAVLLEDEPAEIELLAPQRAFVRPDAGWRLEFKGWKRYHGPLEDLQLDLNEGRTWDEISGLELPLALPPSGLTLDPELLGLLEEIRARP